MRQSARPNKDNLPVRFQDPAEGLDSSSISKIPAAHLPATRTSSPTDLPSPATTINLPTKTTSYEGPYCLHRSSVARVQRPNEIGLTLDDQWYPYTRWELLRDGPILALIRCMAKHFSLPDTICVLGLDHCQATDLQELLNTNPNIAYTIHADELVHVKRYLLTQCRESDFSRDVCVRLGEYKDVTTTWEEIRGGEYDLGGKKVCLCVGEDLKLYEGRTGLHAWLEEPDPVADDWGDTGTVASSETAG